MPDWTLYSLGISSNGYTLTLIDSLIVLGTSVGLSLLISLVYIFTRRKTGYQSSTVLTILFLSPCVAAIVLCIGSNLARAISIGGGLALIRFRNTVEDTKDMVYLLLSLAIGVACGIGFVGFAVLAAIFICLIFMLTTLIGYDRVGSRQMRLHILIPEDLNYDGVFDDTLKEYCSMFLLDTVKTTDYGTVLQLDYRITMKDKSKQKEMVDALRTLNGNLNISLVLGPTR